MMTNPASVVVYCPGRSQYPRYPFTLCFIRRFAAGLVLLALAVHSACAATLSWSGGAANGNWTNSANWGYAGTPANFDTLIFPGGVANLVSSNTATGLVLSQIRFAGPSGGYDIRGTAFTLTNGIIATNTAGANSISNSITLTTADATINVGNGAALALAGQLSGTVGVTKTGAGTLTYQYTGSNPYSGPTRVNAGTLQLNVHGTSAFGGSLIIGDGSGTGSPTVRLLQKWEISDAAPITINLNGLLDLNNNDEIISASLTLSGANIQTGSGTLSLAPNAVVTLTSGSTYIYGALDTGSGTLTFQGNGGIYLYANVSGTAQLVQNDTAAVTWAGANTYSGNYTANGNAAVYLWSSGALGNATNQMTLNGNSLLLISGPASLTNQSLTLNSTNARSLWVYGNTNSWTSAFVLGAPQGVQVDTNCALTLVGSISGNGGVTKTGPGRLVYAGSTGNTYSGTTVVSQGELDLAKSSGLAIPSNGGGLVIGDGIGTDIVRHFGNAQIWASTTPLTINSSGILDLNGYYDGTSPVTLNGGQILAGMNFFSVAGAVNVNLPSTITGRLRLDSSAVVISNVADLTLNAQVFGLSSSYGLTKTGTGNLSLGGSNSYGGLTLVQQGGLFANSPWALGTTAAGTVVSNNATLSLGAGVGITNESLTLNGVGMSTVWGALDVEDGVCTWAGPITLNADSRVDAWRSGSELHIIGPIAGSGGLELFGSGTGGGTHFFEGSSGNTYAGPTTVDSSVRLMLNKSPGIAAIPAGSLQILGTVTLMADNQTFGSVNLNIGNTGLLDLNGHSDYVGPLTGSGRVNIPASFLVANYGGAGNCTFDGVISGAGSFYSGGGTLTLTGSNTLTGSTMAWVGTTVVNGYQPQSPVTIYSGATLAGTGTVGEIVANGTLAPGSPGSPGILTCSNVSFSGTGKLAVQLNGPNPGTGYSQLNVRGTNNLGYATLAASSSFSSPALLGQPFVILNNDGSDSITGTFNSLPQGATLSAGLCKFTIAYNAGSGNDVALTLTDIPVTPTTSAVTAGDGDHVIEPYECNALDLVISNKNSVVSLSGVNATLSTTTKGVVVTQPYSAYPNLPANGKATNTTPFQISTLSGFTAGTDINLQLSVDSSAGSFTMPYLLPTGTVGTSNRYDVTGNVSIPDVGSVDSTNVVSGFPSLKLEKVAVSLYITHTYDGDLTNISLIAPDGTTVLLSSANGGSSANYGSALSPDSSRTTFDDAAATPITSGTAPFVGSFRPQSPLAAFIGNASPNGNWRLHIADGDAGTIGTLRGWSLYLYPVSTASGSGSCDYCLTSVPGFIGSSDPTLTGHILRNNIISSCGAPKAWPGTAGGTYYYHLHTFTNTSAADACVTVTLSSSHDLQAVLYLGAFNPGDITQNYIGDSGGSTFNGTQSCSATVPAGATFVVMVTPATVTGSGFSYTLQLSGLPCPTPTLAISPVSASSVRVHWPTWAGGYKLESTPALTVGPGWSDVTNEPCVAGYRYNVTNTITSTNRLYRLYKP